MSSTEENKIIVLGVTLDIGAAIEGSKNLQDEIDKIKIKQKELADSGKKASDEYQNNAAQLRGLQKEYQQNNKLIDNANKLRKEEKGSLDAMKTQLSLTTASYNKLSKEQRENTEVGISLQQQIKGLSDELGEAEGALGNHTRKVGNYKEALASLPGPFAAAGEGVSGLKKQFVALMANPIVLAIAAIVLAVKGLHAAFTSTDSGALEFEVRMNQASSVLNVAKERAFSFGNAIIDLFKGDKEGAAKKMAEAFGITGQSFADAAEQARIYTEALDEIDDAEKAYVAKSAENRNKIAKLEFDAADKSKSKEERQKALDDAIKLEREETNVKTEEAAKRLEVEAKNLAAKIGLRGVDLTKFVAMTEAERKQQHAVLQDKYNTYHEEFEALTELYAKKVDADTTYYENTRKLNAKSTALDEQLNAEKKQKHEEYLRAKEERENKAFEANQNRLKDEKAAIDARLLDDVKGSQQQLQDLIALAQKQMEIELSQKNLTANMKLLIEKQYNANVRKLYEDNAKVQEDIARKSINEQIKILDDHTKRAQLNNTKELLNRKQALDELHSQGLISEQEYQTGLAEVQFEAQQNAKQLQIDDLNAKILLEQEGSTKKLEMETQVSQLSQDIKKNEEDFKRNEIKKTAAADKAAMQARLQFAQNFFGGLASLFEQGSAEYKAFASLQVAASTAQGAMGAFAQASAVAPPPLGQILGLAAAGVVVAQGVLQLNKINQLERGGLIFPKAERGMMIGGKPHSQGGTKFYGDDGTLFEAEKDEYLAIVNKRSTGMLRNLSAWNMAGGGHDFFGGARSYLADGGLAARTLSQPVLNAIEGQQKLETVMMNLPPQVVFVEHIASALGNAAKVKSRAEL